MILRFLFFIRTFLKHCKALSTEKYKRYINIAIIIIIIIIIRMKKILRRVNSLRWTPKK